MAEILGIHHMSALSGPAQETVDFYHQVLGMRLVKLTVNFDDPGAYHLYYGDGAGTPGSLLTFFPYPGGYPGRPGAGQATVTTLSVPPGSVAYWVDRFKRHDVDFDRPSNRQGLQFVTFRAPDGLLLELAAGADHLAPQPWSDSPVPEAYRPGLIRSVTLVEREIGPTEDVLIHLLGFRKTGEFGNRHRYEVAGGGVGNTIDLVEDPEGPSGRGGHGSVHHIAFRTANDETQEVARQEIVARGLPVTQVRDRDYFRSIYFREPGGVLFEIATDGPGFAVDEAPDALGTSLKLPVAHEVLRQRIERMLPTLKLPTNRPTGTVL